MHRITMRTAARLALPAAAALGLTACPNNGGTPVTPQVTSVGKTVTTLQKLDGIATCGSAPNPPDVQAWWNAMPAANHDYPFAGWMTSRVDPGACALNHVDQYRAVVTFNLAPVANLKGLVQKAELVVATRAEPAAARAGGAVTVGRSNQPGAVTLFCPENVGGAGQLVRFGPQATVPGTASAGTLQQLGAAPFPSGTAVVYTLPPSFTPGPLAGAANPTTIAAGGLGRATITTDVTSQVTAALNGQFASMSWMLTSNFEGPLPFELPVAGELDCRTSYDFDLRITHL